MLAGQLIAQMGLSGDTSFPHIHYQLQTGVESFQEEGLPSYFHDFRRIEGSKSTAVSKGLIGTGEVIESTAAGSASRPAVPAREGDGTVKVLVYYDMEGLSGIDDWRMTTFSRTDPYRRGQDRLVTDVNAVIEGLFEARSGCRSCGGRPWKWKPAPGPTTGAPRFQGATHFERRAFSMPTPI